MNIKDRIVNFIICLAAIVTVTILGCILAFIVSKGISNINLEFLTNQYEDKINYVYIDKEELKNLKLKEVEYNNKILFKVESNKLKGYLTKIEQTKLEGLNIEQVKSLLKKSTYSQKVKLRMLISGGGIFPMLVNTLIMIVLSLAIAVPIGVSAAIYLVEYAKPGKLVNIIRFGTEALAGIPSIIYGLFGMLFFVTYLKLGYSLVAGALTVSIILLPTIIRQTEESLKTVPESYRQASLGLGVTKFQTITKVVLPSAIPGIIVAIILSIGRIVGESAALLLTAGTVAKLPDTLFDSGATLTVTTYWIAKETGDIQKACSIGIVIIGIVVIINIIAKLISSKFENKY